MSEATGSHHAMIGCQFPGGNYTLEPWRAWLLADALGADPGDEQPHPVMAWIVAVGGMGMSWDELFAWFDATADDGPMFGEHETTLHAPLKPAVTYRVSGKITSFDRKTGRRAGTFDIVGYELSLHDGQQHVATCWNSLVLPRRSPA